jgi:hypothetical protein
VHSRSSCCMFCSNDLAPWLLVAFGESLHVCDLIWQFLLGGGVAFAVLSPWAPSWSDPGFLRTRRSLSEKPRLSGCSAAVYLSTVSWYSWSRLAVLVAMIGDPGKALLSASYGEKTVSNFGERSGPAEGKVSWSAKYIIDGGRSNALGKPSFAIRTGELSML